MSLLATKRWTRSWIAAGAVLVIFLACGRGEKPSQIRGWERAQPLFAAPVVDLLRDSDDPDRLYAACGWTSVGSGELSGGILRSRDGGRSWEKTHRGLPPHTEVLTLAASPCGFPHDGHTLFAGTRGAGIYVSTDHAVSWQPTGITEDGPEWERLTIQSIVVVPGDPVAVVLGTGEVGILVSEDGGASFTRQNDDLTNLNVKALAWDGETLFAGTWYGGLFSAEPGVWRWSPIDRDYAQTAFSSVAITADGTLWAGIQNGGLVARPIGTSALEPQGGSAVAGSTALDIAVEGSRILAGTSGRGVAIGTYGNELTIIDHGLDNTVVAAILVDPAAPESILLGTWNGFYRSLPSSPWWMTPAVLVVSSVILALIGVFFAYGSVPALAWIHYYRMGRLEPRKMPFYLNRLAARLRSAPEASPLLTGLAKCLEHAPDASRVSLAEIVDTTAPVLALIRKSGGRLDEASRRELAGLLDQRVDALERSGEKPEQETGIPSDLRRRTARQDRLYASLLRAESPAHLATLRGEVRLLEEEALAHQHEPFLNADLISSLRQVLEDLESLEQLPGAEDRSLLLSKALTRTIEAQQVLVGLSAAQPALGLVVGGMALESLRQLLATALQDIKHRAELELELKTRQLTAHRETAVVLEVRNIGHGPAHNIRLELVGSQKDLRVPRPRQHLKSLLRQQSARLEFLVEPLQSDRIRLVFRATYDDLEREDVTRELADVVDFRRLSGTTPFRPLHPNPYVVGRPLLEDDPFVGREVVFERLVSSFQGARQDNVVVLIGQRRMGKTSILRRLHSHLPASYLAALVDLQGFFGSGESAFFRELTAQICDELEEQEVEIETPPPPAFFEDPGHFFRRRFLPQVCDRLGGRRLLIIFDEMEVIEERIRAAELTPRILPYLRSLMQHEERISFMLAGNHRLDELTADYWGVLFNLAVYLEVGHLAEGDVTSLFLEPTRECFKIDSLALEKIYRTTGGHPHFSQLVARELVDYRNRCKLAYVTVQDVNEVIDTVIDKGQLHIGYLWGDATRDERLLMLAAKELLGRDGPTTIQAAHHYLSERRVEATDLPEAARRLKRRQILDSDNSGLGFRIDLLRRWLERYHDLESFTLSGAGRKS